MNTPIDIQIIRGADGQPAFAVIPYAEYLRRWVEGEGSIPNEVVGMTVKQGMTPIQAWREYLGLTQAEVASRLDISLGAFAEMEASEEPQRPMLARVAAVLGLGVDQLDF